MLTLIDVDGFFSTCTMSILSVPSTSSPNALSIATPISSISPSSSSVFFSPLLLFNLYKLSFRKAYIFRVIYDHLQYGILLPCSTSPLILALATQVSLLPSLTVEFISHSRYDRRYSLGTKSPASHSPSPSLSTK